MTSSTTHLESGLYSLRGRLGECRRPELLLWRYRIPEPCPPRRKRGRFVRRRERADAP